MSRESVNTIIEQAVADDTFFDLLQADPDQAIAGFELDPSEVSAFHSRAYSVVVKATRRDRAEKAERESAQLAASLEGAAKPPAGPSKVRGRSSGALPALAGFALGIVVVAAGLGGYRYLEKVWPWQALGLTARPASVAPAGVAGSPSAGASAAAAKQPVQGGAATPVASAPSGGDPVASAYYQSVGMSLARFLGSFSATYDALEAGKDPGQDLRNLGPELNDLKQQVAGATPPNPLQQDHQALVQIIAILQADTGLMQTAVSQNNTSQAVLLASQMNGLLDQIPDEVAFAMEAHPELYQSISSSRQLPHALNYDVVSQNVTRQGYNTPMVVMRVALQKSAPSVDEVIDSARQAIVDARQSNPQATHVRVVAYAETNTEIGGQVGAADWFCGPDERPQGVDPKSSWQTDCNKVYVTPTLPGSNPGQPQVVSY